MHGGAKGNFASGHGNRRGGGEDSDHGAIAGLVRIGHGHAEMPAQVLITADPLGADEGLRRGAHALVGLEPGNLLRRGQQVVINIIALPLQQMERPDAIGTDVLASGHPVEDGFAGWCSWFSHGGAVINAATHSKVPRGPRRNGQTLNLKGSTSPS